MNRPAAKVALRYQPTHFHHLKSELIVVADSYLQITIFSHLHQRFPFFSPGREWFFQINMTSGFEALLGERIMALWRGGDVNHIRRGRLQHLLRIGKTCRDPKAFPQLLCHQRFPIANRYNLAVRNAMNGLNMLVGTLSATNYCCTE